jgi:hypothetical protein
LVESIIALVQIVDGGFQDKAIRNVNDALRPLGKDGRSPTCIMPEKILRALGKV